MIYFMYIYNTLAEHSINAQSSSTEAFLWAQNTSEYIFFPLFDLSIWKGKSVFQDVKALK